MTQKIRDRLDFLITLAYYAAIGLLVYLGLKYVLGWILPFILAFCIVSVVNPIIRFFNNKLKFKHAAASITVMVLTYGLIGVLLFELILQLVFVFRDLFSMLPSYYDDSIAPALKRTGDNI
ncbi:MAG: hypothetical protein LBV27_00685, partial [Oscillospiraceae bacterium]|nr:hypothetical protein [Oscillospiraceae bacterium]